MEKSWSTYVLGKQWFYYLKGGEKARKDGNGTFISKGLFDCTPINIIESSYIIQWETEIKRNPVRLYAIFENVGEIYDFMNKVAPERRTFYEVITRERKILFDCDIDLKTYVDVMQKAGFTLPEPPNKDNYKQNTWLIVQELVLSIATTLQQYGINLNPYENILIYKSHGYKKHSYHIVIDGFYHADNKEAKAFYNLVISKISRIYKPFIDSAVYSSTQQFRLLGCHKLNQDRTKVFMEEFEINGIKYPHTYPEQAMNPKHMAIMQIIQSMASIIKGDLLPSFITEEDRKIYTPTLILNSELARIMEMINDQYGDAFSYSKTIKGIICLKRNRASYCDICETTHDNQDPFLYITGYNRSVYLDCRRAADHGHPGGRSFIGKLDIINEPLSGLDDEEDEDFIKTCLQSSEVSETQMNDLLQALTLDEQKIELSNKSLVPVNIPTPLNLNIPLKLTLSPKTIANPEISDEKCKKYISEMFKTPIFIKSINPLLKEIPLYVITLIESIYFSNKPKISQFLCSDLAIYLISSGIIKYSDQGYIYLYDDEIKLYTPVHTAGALTPIITKISYQVCEYYSAMTYYITNDPCELTNHLYDEVLIPNNGKFLSNVRSPGNVLPNAIFSHLTYYYSKATPILWLHEEGHPGFLPTKDGNVIEIDDEDGNINYKPRDHTHAFVEGCSLLSMKYTQEEIKKAVDDIKQTDRKEALKHNKFINLIKDIANNDTKVYKQLMYLFGIILSGNPIKALPCLYSSWTDSGKSTITKLQKYLLGNKAQSFDHGLISGNLQKVHQTEKMRLRGLWLAILDETAKTEKFQYNDKDLQILTSGFGVEIGGRLANSPEICSHKNTTTIQECSNYIGGQPFRKYRIEFKSGYCNNLLGPYPSRWYKNQVSQELKDELMQDGAIKLKNPTILNEIMYDRDESLYMLAWCIYYANLRFKNPKEIDDLIINEDVMEDDGPASLISFMALRDFATKVTIDDFLPPKNDSKSELEEFTPYINTKGTNLLLKDKAQPNQFHNPYTYSAPDQTPSKYLVQFKDYYDKYRQYCTTYLQDTKPITKHTMKEYLKDKNLLRGTDRVKFLTALSIDIQLLGPVLDDFYEILDEDMPISSGLYKAAVHEDIAKYIRMQTTAVQKKDPKFIGWYVPTPDDILAWIIRNRPTFIKGSGTSSGRSYYHVKRLKEFILE